jgi:hypothetical protein
MYIMLKEFGIKPWERTMDYNRENGIPNVYEEDMQAILTLRRYEDERDKKESKRQESQSRLGGIKQRAAMYDFSKDTAADG